MQVVKSVIRCRARNAIGECACMGIIAKQSMKCPYKDNHFPGCFYTAADPTLLVRFDVNLGADPNDIPEDCLK